MFVAVPDLAPEGLSYVETKSNSGLLQWSIPLRSGRNGIILQYIIELYAVTSQEGEFQNIKNFTVVLDNPTFDSPSTITYNVTDLSSNTVYRWRVAAVNSAGVGLFTTTAGFTTSEEGGNTVWHYVKLHHTGKQVIIKISHHTLTANTYHETL